MRMPGSLEQDRYLTSSSLQNYLATEVPRTLRATRTGAVDQTPWVYGALSSEFIIADVAPILSRRKAVVDPNVKQLIHVRIYREIERSVRQLSGFEKEHSVPKSVNNDEEFFVASIAEKDITSDLNGALSKFRSALWIQKKRPHNSKSQRWWFNQ